MRFILITVMCMRFKNTFVLTSALVLSLAACSPASSDETETAERRPRISVATETGVVVLDENLKQVASFELGSRPTLTEAHDDRHVFATRMADNKTNVVDSGSWAQGHGDHYHFYVGEPSLADETIAGSKPVHVVANSDVGTTAIFADGDGAATVIQQDNFASNSFKDLATVEANFPHHGLVAPMPDGHYIVSAAPDAQTPLPATLELRHGAEDVEETYTCSGLHGEVVSGWNAAFGCEDSVLVIKEGKGENIPNPDAAARVGALVANKDFTTIVGTYGDALVFVKDGKATKVDVPVAHSNISMTPDGHVVTLGVDGKLYVYDANGELADTIDVGAAWEKPEGHGGVAPSVTSGEFAGANIVWVSEPGANKVHMVDLFTQKTTATDVADQPASIASTNDN